MPVRVDPTHPARLIFQIVDKASQLGEPGPQLRSGSAQIGRRRSVSSAAQSGSGLAPDPIGILP
jgi:hypothetical protein